jgi:hypothetical protein
MIFYDAQVIDLLLNLLTYDPPFRLVTFRLICSLICHLTYNKSLVCSLKSAQLSNLSKAYTEAIA